MGERRCRYCEKAFQPSKYQPQQTVCSEVDCQKRRRIEYRQQKLNADEEYRQVCRDSSRKWRSRNVDYWKQYRAKHPDAVARNLEKQKARDTRQHLRDLANNTSALDLKHSAAAVWLLNGQAADLANNNSVSAQVWIIEALPRRKGPGSESCKQQPAGTFSAFAG
ncbi:MAG: hypothetical protein WB524_10390 [Acidobacteriaceae bacterium]